MRRLFLLLFAAPLAAQSKVTATKAAQSVTVSVVSAQRVKASVQLRVAQPAAVWFTIYRSVVNGVPQPFSGPLMQGVNYCLFTVAKDTTNTRVVTGAPIFYTSSDTSVAKVSGGQADTTIDPLVLLNTPGCP